MKIHTRWENDVYAARALQFGERRIGVFTSRPMRGDGVSMPRVYSFIGPKRKFSIERRRT